MGSIFSLKGGSVLEKTVQEKLEMYIKAELGDEIFYEELAKMAPNADDCRILLEIAEEEGKHAKIFQRIYKRMTGIDYAPEIEMPQMMGSYQDILRDRVIDESGDYRKYGKQYLMTMHDMELKDAYYNTRTDENVHALRLLYLLSK